MRRIIWLLILMASVWLGVAIESDPGYALLAYHTWTVEMPLWFAVLLWLISVLLLSLVFKGAKQVWRWRATLQRWHQHRRQQRVTAYSQAGALAWLEGDVTRAEQQLAAAARVSSEPLIYYLGAALAAKQQAHSRTTYLQQAEQAMPTAHKVIQLTRAQLQIAQGDTAAARDTLQALCAEFPGEKSVLRALQQVYVLLADWQPLHDLLPVLRQYHVLPKPAWEALAQQVYRAYFLAALQQQQDIASVQAAWHALSKTLQHDVMIVSYYAQCLLAAALHVPAEALLRRALSHAWQREWIICYGRVQASDAYKPVQTAEKWLLAHVDDADLLLTLGQLCVHAKLWGKAKQYAETSLRMQPQPQTYFLLAQLAEQLGDKEAVQHYYRDGLQHALRSAKTPL